MNDMNLAPNQLRIEPAPATLADNAAGNRVGISSLANLISILRRRKWVVLSVLAAAIFGGLAVTLLMSPVYTASTTLEIKREDSGLVNIDQNSRAANSVDMEFYQTQYGLLQSESLAERVAVSLKLYDDASFFATFGSRVAKDWFNGNRLTPAASTRERRTQEAGKILLQHLSVIPERLSRLVTVRFSSPDPALSARIANAWGQNFIDSTIERRYDSSSYARKFLEGRLDQLRQRIDQAERRLVGYAARENIINLPTTSAGPNGENHTQERSLVDENLVRLNQELAGATADRIAAQSRLGSRDAVNESLTNQAIAAMRGRRAELAGDYAKMLVQFQPDYPPARALQSQMQQIDRAIAQEEGRVTGAVQATYRAALRREQQLRGQVDALKSGVLDLRQRSIQYNILQRDADTNRQLYDALLQRYKQIGVAGGVGANNISVVDQAEVPEHPSSPKISLNLAIALLLGLLAGTASAFVLENLDHGVADPTTIEPSFGLPLLGTIPKTDDQTIESSLDDPKSWVSEAYMAVQTNLSFSTDHGFPRTLALTSTRQGEGKSSTAYALARALVRRGRRVILIDADMRRPRVHSQLGLDNTAGLSNFLAGEDDVASLIRKVPNEDLSVVTAGQIPPSAPELLSTDRFSQLLSVLIDSFDHIIVDCPPVMGLADAPLITAQLEGTVFVVEAQHTSRKMIEVALGRLRAARSQLFGIVLTKFDPKRANFGYGYEYGYGYGYEETRNRGRRTAKKRVAE